MLPGTETETALHCNGLTKPGGSPVLQEAPDRSGGRLEGPHCDRLAKPRGTAIVCRDPCRV